MNYDLKFFAAIVPIVVLNILMLIWCLSDWKKRKDFKYLDKKVWLLLILFVQILGPLLYLLIGRSDEND